MSVPRIPLIIDNEKVQSKTSKWVDVLNPANQEVVAQVPFCEISEVDAAIASAKKSL